MLRLLASLAAPPLCAICSAACGREYTLCEGCRTALEPGLPVTAAIPGCEIAWAAHRYSGTARSLVAALKFSGRLALAGEAAGAIAPLAAIAATGTDVLVPVPAAPRRRRVRGFDPVALITAQLSERLERAWRDDVLAREDGPRQVGRTREERIASPPVVHCLRGVSSAVLIDDVITTGATLAACAAALREGGCDRVSAVALARSGGVSLAEKALGKRSSRA